MRMQKVVWYGKTGSGSTHAKPDSCAHEFAAQVERGKKDEVVSVVWTDAFGQQVNAWQSEDSRINYNDAHTPKYKLVLAWVDLDGFERTGRFRDTLRHYPETRAIPEAKAACWDFDTPERRSQLLKHIAQEAPNHLFMTWYRLPYQDDILKVARIQALADYRATQAKERKSPPAVR